MRHVPKTDLSPEMARHRHEMESGPTELPRLCRRNRAWSSHGPEVRLPELIVYDHIGFKGAYARTNLSFHYLGDFWNDRISSLIVVSGVWRFYRDEYYKGDHWDLGPGFYECFFTEKGPDDVVSSFQAIALT